MMIRRRRDRPGISASGGQAVNRTDLDQEAEGSLPTVQLWLVLHTSTLYFSIVRKIWMVSKEVPE